MKRSRLSVAPIAFVLKPAEEGTTCSQTDTGTAGSSALRGSDPVMA